MKLATLKSSSRDGVLVVVNRNLTLCLAVPAIARTLQEALDNWDAVEGKLRATYDALNQGQVQDAQAFDPA